MKNFLKITAFFCLFLFILDKAFYFLLEEMPKKEIDKRLEYLVEGQINKDVIVIGSSRGFYNIQTKELEKKTGFKTYNLAYKGADISYQLFILKTLLKFNKKPKFILLALDDSKELLQEKTLKFRYDRLFPLVKYQHITQELIDKNEISPFAKFLYLARLNQNSFNFSKKVSDDKAFELGSGKLFNQSASANFSFLKEEKSYDENLEITEKYQDFIDFQRICNENNIQLILVYPPNFKEPSLEFEKRIKSITKFEAMSYKYDYSNLKYKDKNYFYDESHLNQKGAIEFTNELSIFINSIKN